MLILDEPTSNLDPVGTEEVLDAVDRVRERTGVIVLDRRARGGHRLRPGQQGSARRRADRARPRTPREFIDQHGLEVRDRMGLWIPQACEVALGCGHDGGTRCLASRSTGPELVESVSALGLPEARAEPPPMRVRADAARRRRSSRSVT